MSAQSIAGQSTLVLVALLLVTGCVKHRVDEGAAARDTMTVADTVPTEFPPGYGGMGQDTTAAGQDTTAMDQDTTAVGQDTVMGEAPSADTTGAAVGEIPDRQTSTDTTPYQP
jgi:hypothetical protein